MINKKLLPHHCSYQADSACVKNEYESLPWADRFVQEFANWLTEHEVFTWPNGVPPKKVQPNLKAFLQKEVPSPFVEKIHKKMMGDDKPEVNIAGFLMGRALALEALKDKRYIIPVVTDLQRRWWAHTGFYSIIVQDLLNNKATSAAYRMAQKYVERLEQHPENGILGTAEKRHFAQICQKWREEGTLSGLWDNTFSWHHFSATGFVEGTVSDLLVANVELILPLLDGIRIPTIMENILRTQDICYDPDLLQILLRIAQPCTNVDENAILDNHGASTIPVWNGSILAASLLSYVTGYARELLEKKEGEETIYEQEAIDFLRECAQSMIARQDGLFLAKHFVRELHHNIKYRSQEQQSSMLFLDAIVDAVKSEKKNTLAMHWITLKHNEEMKKRAKAQWERFMQTGLQSEKQNNWNLEALVAYVQLLTENDLQGDNGKILREAYEWLFCFADEGFYTSEYSDVLPSPMHDVIASFFPSVNKHAPIEEWEHTWKKLEAATNRIFRDYLCTNKLQLMYVQNFHLAAGLALADNAFTMYGADIAKKVLCSLFDHLMDKLRMNDRLDDFYKKMVCILICKVYMYHTKNNEGQKQNTILAELATYLQKIQSIPMLAFKSVEALMLNGLSIESIKLCPELKEVAIKTYQTAQFHDFNDHWKKGRATTIEKTLKRRLTQLGA